ncbi:MAG: SURF1 family protein [Burkholderiales bacterium]|nr:SURF1 family protein [Burkholderiales bacterium]
MPISFRIRLWPLIVAALLISLGISLGQWQTRRAVEKENYASQIEQRAQLSVLALRDDTAPQAVTAFRRLLVRGQFVSGWPLYLDNRPLRGKAGFYVLMPLRIEGSSKHVLVARGWQARDPQQRTRLPALVTPSASLALEGIARQQLDRVMQLGQADSVQPGGIIQNLDLDSLSKASGLQFYPFIVEQTSDLADGLQRDWPMPSSGADKHRAYAFQWYALAAMALLFFVVTGFRRGKHR